MKVVHIPYGYHPDAVGGTEVYVGALARSLREHGIDAAVAAPGTVDADYEHAGIAVHRFAITPGLTDLQALYGEGDRGAAARFARWLDRDRPELVHLHAWSSAVSLALIGELRARGIPVVFTYHTPTVSCVRGSLLRWGQEVCDGYLDRLTCTACVLQQHGTGRWPGQSLARVPPSAGRWLGRLGAAGGPWTALRMSELVDRRHSALRTMLSSVDHIVAVCGWAREVLVGNGIAPERITVSRHGLDWSGQRPEPSARARQDRLRVAYLGRLDPVKGVHVLVEAIRSDPALPVSLDVFGVVQGASNQAYAHELSRLAARDTRIALRDPLPNADVVARLAAYDVVAVPSQGLETGPLVVLEAFAAGRPVVGSRLGGIGELVVDGVNGLLVAPASISEWRAALARLSQDERRLVDELAGGVRPPRRWADVVDDMRGVYARLACRS